MKNSGVKCNVCECTHNNSNDNSCTLSCIEVTHEKTTSEGVSVPHFCKSYEIK